MAMKLDVFWQNAYKNHFGDSNNNNLFFMTKHENIYQTCVWFSYDQTHINSNHDDILIFDFC